MQKKKNQDLYRDGIIIAGILRSTGVIYFKGNYSSTFIYLSVIII